MTWEGNSIREFHRQQRAGMVRKYGEAVVAQWERERAQFPLLMSNYNNVKHLLFRDGCGDKPPTCPTIEEVAMRATYDELIKLDDFLELPHGTSRSVLARYNQTAVTLLNERLKDKGVAVQLTEDTNVPRNQRRAWRMLMQQLNISRVWWLDGDPDSATLPDIRVI